MGEKRARQFLFEHWDGVTRNAICTNFFQAILALCKKSYEDSNICAYIKNNASSCLVKG